MDESFLDYKQVLEAFFSSVNFLYSGDVISSTKSKNQITLKSDKFSTSFIIETFVSIYNKSLDDMISNSKEILTPLNDISKDSLSNLLSSLNLNPRFLFCNQKAAKLVSNQYMKFKDSPIPDYFHKIDAFFECKWPFSTKDVSVYYSPIIDSVESEDVIFISVDSAIQSLVYTIQNMNYEISSVGDGFTHLMSYDLYNCKYEATKIVVKNIEKIRNEKIESVLNGN